MEALAKSLPIFCAGSLVVILSGVFGRNYTMAPTNPYVRPGDLIGSFAVWDGEHYARIAAEGYSYDPSVMSNVVFFPAFPIAGRLIAELTGWRIDACLLLVAYAFLFSAFVLAAKYVEATGEPDPGNAGLSRPGAGLPWLDGVTCLLLVLGFFPTTFYMRMAYSESLFILIVILVLYGMKKKWPLLMQAAAIGLGTASRPTGIVLLVPFLWHIWRRSSHWTSFALKTSLLVPVACWGLLAYMGYLYLAFDDPFVFVTAHARWDHRPPIPLVQKLILDLTLEPIRCVYDPSCDCFRFYGRTDPSPLFSMYYANPIYFLFFVGLVAYGGLMGWLSREEFLAGAAILAFSYLGKAHSICMFGQARYAATVFPAYLVMGRLLQSVSASTAAILLALSGFLMGTYTVLFVRWYYFF